jgi:DNA-directed RNA polymerase subunit M/transcription elongation factor TFIIS
MKLQADELSFFNCHINDENNNSNINTTTTTKSTNAQKKLPVNVNGVPCVSCKSKNTVNMMKQSRSPDEGMSQYAVCISCSKQFLVQR